MLGGHLDIARRRTDIYNGNTVYTLRSDYQEQEGQQSGYLRIMRFSPAANMIYVDTYSPNQGKYYPETKADHGENDFSLPYAMNSSEAYTVIGTAHASSGSNAGVVWNGLDGNTEYEWYATASDGQKQTSGPVWTFTTAAIMNHVPVAADDSYSTAEDTTLIVAVPGVLGNDTDVDGDALTAVGVDAPAHGTLTLNPDGSFSYKPAANYNGGDSFSYRVNDGHTDSNVRP